jgi:hypothetical protein
MNRWLWFEYLSYFQYLTEISFPGIAVGKGMEKIATGPGNYSRRRHCGQKAMLVV